MPFRRHCILAIEGGGKGSICTFCAVSLNRIGSSVLCRGFLGIPGYFQYGAIAVKRIH